MKLPIVPEEWGSKTLPRVLSGEKKTRSVAEKPASDRVFLVATDFCDPSVFNGRYDAAGVRAITVAKGLFGFGHIVGEYTTITRLLSGGGIEPPSFQRNNVNPGEGFPDPRLDSRFRE
jgi:hypothetical protein